MIEAGFDINAADPVELIRQGALCIPHGKTMRERFLTPKELPPWLSEADLAVYVEAFERGGLHGPFSFYKNIPADWAFLEAYDDAKLQPPAYFLGSEFDVATWWGAEALNRVDEKIANYVGQTILPGCGHWIQQERIDDTNRVLLEFLSAID